MKVFAPGLIGIVLIIAVRAFFISPWMSLNAIGDANQAVNDVFSVEEPGIPTEGDVRDAVQSSLFEAHGRWIWTLVLFDGILLIAVVAVIYSGWRQLNPSSPCPPRAPR